MKALILLLLCSPVLADDLVYQSQTLPGNGADLDGNQTWSVNDVYTIDVTISGPLAPNLQNAVITPQSWVVTCVYCSTDLSSSPVLYTINPGWIWATAAVFMFSTDATGKITAWNFGISGSANLNGREQNTGRFTSGDTATSVQDLDGHHITISTAGPKGAWTQSSLSAPVQSAPAQRVQPVVRLWFLRM